jgi:tetratricopeptide (TPR) repeat protein
MNSHSTMELDRRFAASQPNDEATTRSGQQLIKLSSWMMVLGTVRLICMLADNANVFADALRIEPFSMRTFARVAHEIHPVVAISAAWPLILAIALRRARWPQLVPAAAATFFVLSIGGMLELWVQWDHARGYGGMAGSFHLPRRAFLRPNVADLALGSLGATQLALELATAIRAILLLPRLRAGPHHPETKAESARRARCGRMALYASIGYLFVVIRLPVWSTYLEVLNNSPLVRNFVLKNDMERLGGRQYSPPLGREPTEEEKRFAEISQTIGVAAEAARSGRFSEARDRYREAIDLIDSLTDDATLENRRRALVAMALNNLAWQEATCSDVSFRNGREAVRHARRATVVQPEEGNYWNTLGAACYRAGQWEDAKAALTQSMALRRNGDSFDWFFLAMVELKLGRPADARQWYERAVQSFHESLPQNEELYRFQVEAAHELGLAKPQAPATASRTGSQPAAHLAPIQRAIRRKSGGTAPKTFRP